MYQPMKVLTDSHILRIIKKNKKKIEGVVGLLYPIKEQYNLIG